MLSSRVLQNTIQQWRKFFIITSGLCFSAGVLFILTWSSEVKEWNGHETNREAADGQELERLKHIEDARKTNKHNL